MVRPKKINSCIGKTCRNGVPAFKKVEHCFGTFQLNLSTDVIEMLTEITSVQFLWLIEYTGCTKK